MEREHRYSINVVWTGNTGQGTSDYRSYRRDHEITVSGKPPVLGSADPKFRGDPARYNPEELLVSALSTCHMLWFLHLCCEAGIVIHAYEDTAQGVMCENPDGSGAFVDVVLNPAVALADPSQREQAA